MGKHADRPTFTQNVRAAAEAVRALRESRAKEPRRGAHAAEPAVRLKTDEPRAKQLLTALKQRPVLTAITVPAAASVLLAGGGLAVLPQLDRTPTVVSAASVDERDRDQGSRSSERDPLQDESGSAGEDAENSESERESTEAEERARSQAEAAPQIEATQKVPASGGGQAFSGESGGSGDVSGEPCSVSSEIESGLTPNAISAYRAVCAEFPEVTSYGGRRNDPGSDHNSGNAVDVMITGATGDRISEFLIQNASELNIKYIIWKQRIWMPGRGWSGMEDRGSATANHFDHVHISVN